LGLQPKVDSANRMTRARCDKHGRMRTTEPAHQPARDSWALFTERLVKSYLLLAVLCLPVLLISRTARAVELRVRGASSLEVIAVGRTADVMVRGALLDEVGASLGRAALKLEARDGTTQLNLDGIGACPGEDTLVRTEGRTTASVTTDERGMFCIVWPGRTSRGSFSLKYGGNKFFDGSEADAVVTPEGEQRASTSLRFDAPPAVLDLEKDQHVMGVTVRIARADAARMLLPASRHEGLAINLVDERGQVVATATTRGDGKARFEVKSSALGPPGDGELRAEFAGDRQLAGSKVSAQVTRTVKVEIKLPERVEGDPDDGIRIDTSVTSQRGPAAGGLVEATLDGKPVGAAPVQDGRAELLITFPGGVERTVEINVRYSANTPYWQPGPPGVSTIHAKGPHPLRQVALAVLGAALVAWIVLKWRRAPKSESRDSAIPPPPSGRPEILVLERPSGLKGWKGQVTDAHDGFAVANADLSIFTLSFDRRTVIAQTKSEADGTFSLEVPDVPKDARLLVEGEFHATYEQLLPAPSILRVALVTRRRALLDRLVRWARVRGTPFDSAREPTPGHVRRVAARTGAERVESWATRVEVVAFGPAPVTRDIEAEVVGNEPTTVPIHAEASPANPLADRVS
jgi:hypothetical protein